MPSHFTLRMQFGPHQDAADEAWHLTPSGARFAVSVEGDDFRLSQPMHQWEEEVFSAKRTP